MRYFPVFGIAVALTAASGAFTAASANPISIGFDLTALPAAAGPVSAVTLTQPEIGRRSLILNGASPNGSVSVTVNTASNQGIVSGSQSGLYAAPVSGGSPSNPNHWSAPYFSTGIGTITLNFAKQQTYLGLLWGSIDAGPTANTVTFYNDGTKIATISGDDIYNATRSNAPNGSQGYGGSYYTLLNDTIGSFDEVVLGGTSVSFESADLQYADVHEAVPTIPAPGAFGLFCVAVPVTLALRRRRGGAC